MLEMILTALAVVIIEFVVNVAILAFAAVVQWFLNLGPAITENDVAFTLKQEVKNGRYTMFQGVLNRETHELGRVRRIEAQGLDARLTEAHERTPLVLYT